MLHGSHFTTSLGHERLDRATAEAQLERIEQRLQQARRTLPRNAELVSVLEARAARLRALVAAESPGYIAKAARSPR